MLQVEMIEKGGEMLNEVEGERFAHWGTFSLVELFETSQNVTAGLNEKGGLGPLEGWLWAAKRRPDLGTAAGGAGGRQKGCRRSVGQDPAFDTSQRWESSRA